MVSQLGVACKGTQALPTLPGVILRREADDLVRFGSSPEAAAPWLFEDGWGRLVTVSSNDSKFGLVAAPGRPATTSWSALRQ